MSEDLDFRVNPDGPIAVYIQIENCIQFAIASGRLKPGATLPSVRDLSSRLNVNPNTVTKAFRDLELMGLITSRRGIGVKIAEKARNQCRKPVQDMVRSHLRDAVGECLSAGLTEAQIRKVVADTIKSGYTPYCA